MDQRLEELKILTRLYRRERRRATGFWKFLCIAAFLLSLPAAPLCLGQIWPDCSFLRMLISLEQQAVWYLGIQTGGLLSKYAYDFWVYLGICLLVCLLAVCMWCFGNRRLKRTDAFLSYRTLKIALEEEKKYEN